MKDCNKGKVSHVDNQRKEIGFRLNELRYQQREILRELEVMKAKADNLLEINATQIAVCDRFLEEVGDDCFANFSQYIDKLGANEDAERLFLMEDQITNMTHVEVN